jgi:hypothetical protein
MSKFKKNLNKILIPTLLLGGSFMLSSQANAGYCLPVTYATTQSGSITGQSGAGTGGMGAIRQGPGCTGIKTIDTFQGEATSVIEQIKEDIVQAGREVKQQMLENNQAIVSGNAQNTSQLIRTIVETTDTQLKDELKMNRAFLDMEMGYNAELKHRELMASRAPLELDDTKEGTQFIIQKLKDTKRSNVQSILSDFNSSYADGAIIPVKIKSGMSTATGSTCPEYDPATTTTVDQCFYAHKEFPADKLQKYFLECSREKRQFVMQTKKAATAKTMNAVQKSDEISFNDSVTTLNKIEYLNKTSTVQRDFSCSAAEMKYKLCDNTLTSQTYVNKVIANEIIPNGSLSATNLFEPTAMGSVDGNIATMTDAEINAVNLKGLEVSKNADGKEVAVSDNTVPIVYTYRTSSQYQASQDFRDNILGKGLVPNQPMSQRRSQSSALYQARYQSRIASLSLAESSFNKAIENRVGKTLRENIDNGTNFNQFNGGKVVKEDINGAGYIDELYDSINKDYQKVVVDKAGKLSSNLNSENIDVMSPEKAKEWQIQAMVKANELSMEQYFQNERIETLLATVLSQMTNSSGNIEFLQQLRRQ